jgi:hypothetical protein
MSPDAFLPAHHIAIIMVNGSLTRRSMGDRSMLGAGWPMVSRLGVLWQGRRREKRSKA